MTKSLSKTYVKIIMTEKNPLKVRIFQDSSNTKIGLRWWYGFSEMSSGEIFNVKTLCNFFEFDCIDPHNSGFFIIKKHYKPSELYLVVDGESKGALILKQDCERVR